MKRHKFSVPIALTIIFCWYHVLFLPSEANQYSCWKPNTKLFCLGSSLHNVHCWTWPPALCFSDRKYTELSPGSCSEVQLFLKMSSKKFTWFFSFMLISLSFLLDFYRWTFIFGVPITYDDTWFLLSFCWNSFVYSFHMIIHWNCPIIPYNIDKPSQVTDVPGMGMTWPFNLVSLYLGGE